MANEIELPEVVMTVADLQEGYRLLIGIPTNRMNLRGFAARYVAVLRARDEAIASIAELHRQLEEAEKKRQEWLERNKESK